MKKLLKKGLGIVCIVLGLIALVTPLTPGSWLVIIGLELLGIRMLIEKKLLKEKHRAAIRNLMKKIGLSHFRKPPDNQSPGRQQGTK